MATQKYLIQITLTEMSGQYVYIDDDWELREDDPIVQTWQACEENLPEELKDDEWDE